MQIVPESEFPLEPDDVVFRERAALRIVVVTLFTAIGIGWMLAPLAGWGGWILAVVFGLPCLFAGGIATVPVWRGLRREHWVLRQRASGLALCLRSYLNADLPRESARIVWIQNAEIRCVRSGRVARRLPGSRGHDRHESEKFLDIELVHDRTHDFARALDDERRAPRRGRTHFTGSCVRLVRPDTIRITWSDARVLLRPSLAQAMTALGHTVTVADPVPSEPIDWRAMDERAIDDTVLELCERGARIDAITLLRTRRGWDLARAKQFVDELCGTARAA